MERTLTGTYAGHEIWLLPNWTFEVIGPEFDGARYHITFQSRKDASAEISKRVEEARKAELKNVKLKAIVLTEQGVRKTITSINRNSGSISGIEVRYVYPDVAWIAEVLHLRNKLWEELKLLDNRLAPLAIRTERSYSGIHPEDYSLKVKNLLDEINAKMEEAKNAL